MKCARCKIDLIRIEYPATRCTSPTGKRLARTVDRCPCCGLEWQDMPNMKAECVVTGAERELVQQPQPEQIFLFDEVIGGFK
ncbi:hypothetical protein D3C74_186240 [compost metagenome]